MILIIEYLILLSHLIIVGKNNFIHSIYNDCFYLDKTVNKSPRILIKILKCAVEFLNLIGQKLEIKTLK